MSDEQHGRLRYELPEIGAAVELYRPWPVLSLADVGASGVYQPVGDTTGIVFVRYGADETVDAYVAQLGGMLSEVSVLRDQPVEFAGARGRHVVVRMTTRSREVYRSDSNAGISHETLPVTRTLLSVIGISHRGTPILVGYRVPEEAAASYATVLEEIVHSVTLS